MNCGRIVIPVDIRNEYNISEKDSMEVYIEGQTIILKKHRNSCVICRKEKNLNKYDDRHICSECINKIKNMY